MNHTEDHKLKVLLAAFHDRRNEVAYWRGHAWHVVVFFLAACALLSAAGSIGHVQNPGATTFFLAIVATLYTVRTIKSVDAATRRLTEIEDALGFFEEGHFVRELALQPVAAKNIIMGATPMALYVAAIWCGVIIATF